MVCNVAAYNKKDRGPACVVGMGHSGGRKSCFLHASLHLDSDFLPGYAVMLPPGPGCQARAVPFHIPQCLITFCGGNRGVIKWPISSSCLFYRL